MYTTNEKEQASLEFTELTAMWHRVLNTYEFRLYEKKTAAPLSQVFTVSSFIRTPRLSGLLSNSI